ncbi:hypothetical protein [Vagococcus fluvialis]|uniref:hypothetical protein n=1 Tax=Vagococcus fluvialis TaxID=2738 RepID=UPI002B2EBEE3|nr:hypothetical protein QDW48_05630 [Vagococcus fluvialis]
MNYDDVKLFEKIRYSKVVFSKIVLSIIIAFLPFLDTYLSKVEIAFLAYLGLSLFHTCFAISRNYLITILLAFFLPVGLFLYLDSLNKQGYISDKTSMFLDVAIVFLPFFYNFHKFIEQKNYSRAIWKNDQSTC